MSNVSGIFSLVAKKYKEDAENPQSVPYYNRVANLSPHQALAVIEALDSIDTDYSRIVAAQIGVIHEACCEAAFASLRRSRRDSAVNGIVALAYKYSRLIPRALDALDEIGSLCALAKIGDLARAYPSWMKHAFEKLVMRNTPAAAAEIYLTVREYPQYKPEAIEALEDMDCASASGQIERVKALVLTVAPTVSNSEANGQFRLRL